MSYTALPDRRLILIFVESTLLLGALLPVRALGATMGVETPPEIGAVLFKGCVAVGLVQLCLFYCNVYDDRALRSRVDFIRRLSQAFASALVLLSVAYYFVPSLRVSPGFLLVYLPVALAIVLVWHVLHRSVRGTEALRETVLILGSGHSAQLVATEMMSRAPLGYRVAGFVGESPAEVGRVLVHLEVLGTTADLLSLVARYGVNRIVVAQEDRRGKLPVEELMQCRVSGVNVEDGPDFFERLTGKILLSDLRPSWFVFSPGFSKPRLLRGVKRSLELVAAALALVLISPLLGLLAALVRLESRGPAFYGQTRVGEGGRVFTLLKLRTMREDAEAKTGPVWASAKGDPRITRVGRILRKLRLDELPQLVNVLRGDMGFVGPRPERPHFVERLRRVIPYYDERHRVRPGITGWAQVMFGYGSTIEDSERKLQFDLYYIKNMSLFLDVAIVLNTVRVMVVGRGAR